ncbi:hypothetical protein BESB_008480 [Besnoitia besnoiti]|uniref:TTI1 C-terminal TPR domain-containing protein n=1 Tax=Besnoitia besnoiti TaxID=94643 RepID=A0A2A9MQ04_BESBE|nr:hypothetical protein BESB_008480 [Besnoitia besnoiti]PFH38506.1 hypothetical protein BESB_008480 [Besnoitia besnoiti]
MAEPEEVNSSSFTSSPSASPSSSSLRSSSVASGVSSPPSSDSSRLHQGVSWSSPLPTRLPLRVHDAPPDFAQLSEEVKAFEAALVAFLGAAAAAVGAASRALAASRGKKPYEPQRPSASAAASPPRREASEAASLAAAAPACKRAVGGAAREGEALVQRLEALCASVRRLPLSAEDAVARGTAATALAREAEEDGSRMARMQREKKVKTLVAKKAAAGFLSLHELAMQLIPVLEALEQGDRTTASSSAEASRAPTSQLTAAFAATLDASILRPLVEAVAPAIALLMQVCYQLQGLYRPRQSPGEQRPKSAAEAEESTARRSSASARAAAPASSTPPEASPSFLSFLFGGSLVPAVRLLSLATVRESAGSLLPVLGLLRLALTHGWTTHVLAVRDASAAAALAASGAFSGAAEAASTRPAAHDILARCVLQPIPRVRGELPCGVVLGIAIHELLQLVLGSGRGAEVASPRRRAVPVHRAAVALALQCLYTSADIFDIPIASAARGPATAGAAGEAGEAASGDAETPGSPDSRRDARGPSNREDDTRRQWTRAILIQFYPGVVTAVAAFLSHAEQPPRSLALALLVLARWIWSLLQLDSDAKSKSARVASSSPDGGGGASSGTPRADTPEGDAAEEAEARSATLSARLRCLKHLAKDYTLQVERRWPRASLRPFLAADEGDASAADGGEAEAEAEARSHIGRVFGFSLLQDLQLQQQRRAEGDVSRARRKTCAERQLRATVLEAAKHTSEKMETLLSSASPLPLSDWRVRLGRIYLAASLVGGCRTLLTAKCTYAAVEVLLQALADEQQDLAQTAESALLRRRLWLPFSFSLSPFLSFFSTSSPAIARSPAGVSSSSPCPASPAPAPPSWRRQGDAWISELLSADAAAESVASAPLCTLSSPSTSQEPQVASPQPSPPACAPSVCCAWSLCAAALPPAVEDSAIVGSLKLHFISALEEAARSALAVAPGARDPSSPLLPLFSVASGSAGGSPSTRLRLQRLLQRELMNVGGHLRVMAVCGDVFEAGGCSAWGRPHRAAVSPPAAPPPDAAEERAGSGDSGIDAEGQGVASVPSSAWLLPSERVLWAVLQLSVAHPEVLHQRMRHHGLLEARASLAGAAADSEGVPGRPEALLLLPAQLRALQEDPLSAQFLPTSAKLKRLAARKVLRPRGETGAGVSRHDAQSAAPADDSRVASASAPGWPGCERKAAPAPHGMAPCGSCRSFARAQLRRSVCLCRCASSSTAAAEAGAEARAGEETGLLESSLLEDGSEAGDQQLEEDLEAHLVLPALAGAGGDEALGRQLRETLEALTAVLPSPSRAALFTDLLTTLAAPPSSTASLPNALRLVPPSHVSAACDSSSALRRSAQGAGCVAGTERGNGDRRHTAEPAIVHEAGGKVGELNGGRTEEAEGAGLPAWLRRASSTQPSARAFPRESPGASVPARVETLGLESERLAAFARDVGSVSPLAASPLGFLLLLRAGALFALSAGLRAGLLVRWHAPELRRRGEVSTAREIRMDAEDEAESAARAAVALAPANATHPVEPEGESGARESTAHAAARALPSCERFWCRAGARARAIGSASASSFFTLEQIEALVDGLLEANLLAPSDVSAEALAAAVARQVSDALADDAGTDDAGTDDAGTGDARANARDASCGGGGRKGSLADAPIGAGVPRRQAKADGETCATQPLACGAPRGSPDPGNAPSVGSEPPMRERAPLRSDACTGEEEEASAGKREHTAEGVSAIAAGPSPAQEARRLAELRRRAAVRREMSAQQLTRALLPLARALVSFYRILLLRCLSLALQFLGEVGGAGRMAKVLPFLLFPLYRHLGSHTSRGVAAAAYFALLSLHSALSAPRLGAPVSPAPSSPGPSLDRLGCGASRSAQSRLSGASPKSPVGCLLSLHGDLLIEAVAESLHQLPASGTSSLAPSVGSFHVVGSVDSRKMTESDTASLLTALVAFAPPTMLPALSDLIGLLLQRQYQQKEAQLRRVLARLSFSFFSSVSPPPAAAAGSRAGEGEIGALDDETDARTPLWLLRVLAALAFLLTRRVSEDRTARRQRERERRRSRLPPFEASQQSLAAGAQPLAASVGALQSASRRERWGGDCFRGLPPRFPPPFAWLLSPARLRREREKEQLLATRAASGTGAGAGKEAAQSDASSLGATSVNAGERDMPLCSLDEDADVDQEEDVLSGDGDGEEAEERDGDAESVVSATVDEELFVKEMKEAAERGHDADVRDVLEKWKAKLLSVQQRQATRQRKQQEAEKTRKATARILKPRKGWAQLGEYGSLRLHATRILMRVRLLLHTDPRPAAAVYIHLTMLRCIYVLTTRKRELLPRIHELWPSLLPSLRAAAPLSVLVTTLAIVTLMATSAGSFVRERFASDVLPPLLHRLQSHPQPAGERDEESRSDQFKFEYAWLSLLLVLAAPTPSFSTSFLASVLGEILFSSCFCLHRSAAPALQAQAQKLLHRLNCVNTQTPLFVVSSLAELSARAASPAASPRSESSSAPLASDRLLRLVSFCTAARGLVSHAQWEAVARSASATLLEEVKAEMSEDQRWHFLGGDEAAAPGTNRDGRGTPADDSQAPEDLTQRGDGAGAAAEETSQAEADEETDEAAAARARWARRRHSGWMQRSILMFDYELLGEQFLREQADAEEDAKLQDILKRMATRPAHSPAASN